MSQLTKTWQQELAEGFNNVNELCQYLQIPTDSFPSTTNFPLRVPKAFVDQIQKGDLTDPLLKQIIPVHDENLEFSGFKLDPVGDINAMPETGVIHKYQGRALFITTGSCAINCRYCFRRNFPYSSAQLSTQKQTKAINYIEKNKDISEIILSGGDPLLLNNDKLFKLIKQLESIPHIKRIRIHSRIPIVLPSRIDADFCQQLTSIKKHCILVVHANHQNELNKQVQSACNKLKSCNITLLNQSVLLKSINDDANQLVALSEKLFDCGIMPYYLHLLDKAIGTGHFEVKQTSALALMEQIKQILPGYLVPKLVREQAGAANKIIIC